jgi:hypothetical protein
MSVTRAECVDCDWTRVAPGPHSAKLIVGAHRRSTTGHRPYVATEQVHCMHGGHVDDGSGHGRHYTCLDPWPVGGDRL